MDCPQWETITTLILHEPDQSVTMTLHMVVMADACGCPEALPHMRMLCRQIEEIQSASPPRPGWTFE